jgi:hypothetical protein
VRDQDRERNQEGGLQNRDRERARDREALQRELEAEDRDIAMVGGLTSPQ